MNDKCEVNGCTRPRKARGFCMYHYVQWYRTERPLTPLTKCTARGCSGLRWARTLCHSHYMRLIRTGEVGKKPIERRCY